MLWTLCSYLFIALLAFDTVQQLVSRPPAIKNIIGMNVAAIIIQSVVFIVSLSMTTLYWIRMSERGL
jgi:hypothetical protein